MGLDYLPNDTRIVSIQHGRLGSVALVTVESSLPLNHGLGVLVSRCGCFPVIPEARSSRIFALSPKDAGVEDYVHHADFDLVRDKGIEGGPSRWDYGELVQPRFQSIV